jgi:hypothetical protein
MSRLGVGERPQLAGACFPQQAMRLGPAAVQIDRDRRPRDVPRGRREAVEGYEGADAADQVDQRCQAGRGGEGELLGRERGPQAAQGWYGGGEVA